LNGVHPNTEIFLSSLLMEKHKKTVSPFMDINIITKVKKLKALPELKGLTNGAS
jgi:hypothetical protein